MDITEPPKGTANYDILRLWSMQFLGVLLFVSVWFFGFFIDLVSVQALEELSIIALIVVFIPWAVAIGAVNIMAINLMLAKYKFLFKQPRWKFWLIFFTGIIAIAAFIYVLIVVTNLLIDFRFKAALEEYTITTLLILMGMSYLATFVYKAVKWQVKNE